MSDPIGHVTVPRELNRRNRVYDTSVHTLISVDHERGTYIEIGDKQLSTTLFAQFPIR